MYMSDCITIFIYIYLFMKEYTKERSRKNLQYKEDLTCIKFMEIKAGISWYLSWLLTMIPSQTDDPI